MLFGTCSNWTDGGYEDSKKLQLCRRRQQQIGNKDKKTPPPSLSRMDAWKDTILLRN